MLRANNFTLRNLLEMAYGTFYGVKVIPDDWRRADRLTYDGYRTSMGAAVALRG
jgi:hypothetical protein